jgi:dipeptidyl aminopeptidase/acylaminoacyl peptidase
MIRALIISFILTLSVTAVLGSGVAVAPAYSLAQFLNIQYATGPSFNAATSELLYRSNISGVPQIWRMSLGGYQQQVSFDTNGAAGAWWSPTDLKLAVLAAAVGGNERTQLYLINPYGGPWNRLSKDDEAIYRFGTWAEDGSRFAYATNERNKKDFDIYEYNTGSARATLLYQGAGDNAALSYSPDLRYLLIQQTYSNTNSDLLLYDGETGKTRGLTPHGGSVIFSDAKWDADGAGFYFLCDREREFVGLAYWPLDSADFRWVATPDWDIERVVVSKSGVWLAYSINENGISKLIVQNLKTGKQIPPHRFPNVVVQSMSFSNDGVYLALTLGSATKPLDVWIYDTVRGNLTPVSMSATGGIPNQVFREPERITFDSFDQKKIPAWWYLPEKPAAKMPVLVMIHGGPEVQARAQLSGVAQYFLSRGWAILEPNIRGSSGYGKAYLAADDVRKRMDAISDIEYAAKWLAARKDVDSTKLVVWGGSYGGFATLSALTTYPDRWAAGVDIVGIANFVTFLENTGVYRRALREAEYGNLTDDRDFLVEVSPLTHVDKIKAPLFIIQGANDPRVPKGEADQMAEAVRGKGGIVEYMLFEDEGHGLVKTANRLKAYQKVAEFLDNHVLQKK